MHHIVAIRFCVGIADAVRVDRRLTLFEATMAPTLTAQEGCVWPFRVVVQLDPSLGGARRERIERALSPLTVELRDVAQWKDCASDLSEAVAPLATESALTTRVDDDDSMTRAALGEIQAAAAGMSAGFIAIRRGLRYSIPEGGGEWVESSGVAIGLSFLAPPDSTETIYSFHHRRLKEIAKERRWRRTVIPVDRAAWLYLRHDAADSWMRGRERVMAANTGPDALAAFPIDHAAIAAPAFMTGAV